MSSEVDDGEEEVAQFVFDPVPPAGSIHFRLQFVKLLVNLVEDRAHFGPVKADPRGPPLQLPGAQERGKREGDAIERALLPACGAFGRLYLFPAPLLRILAAIVRLIKNMRMPIDEFVGDRLRNLIEVEAAFLLRHARVEDDL